MDKDQEETLNAIIVNESEKIQSLTVLDENAKQIVISSLKYMAIPYMPITQEFIGKTILNDVEYPLLESKMSQAAIEMKSRFNRLIDSQYDLEKTQLEIQELDLDIEDITKDQTKSEARKSLETKKKELDRKIKNYRLTSIKQSMIDSFKEFSNWKNSLDTLLEDMKQADPEINSINDIDFDSIRVEEMKIKTKRWLELYQRGEELTQSQKIFVFDQIMRDQLNIGNKAKKDE
jgi:hypothetical protein